MGRRWDRCLISRPRRSGSGGITEAPSAAAGASSATGTDAEMARLVEGGLACF